MVVTKGHGNPKWTREETILVFKLYHELEGKMLGKHDPRLQSLSQQIRDLPYNTEDRRRTTFRNVDGVRFKLQNLRSVDTGQGLTHVFTMDRLIVAEFQNETSKLKQAVDDIQMSFRELKQNDFDELNIVEVEAFYESRISFARYRKNSKANKKFQLS